MKDLGSLDRDELIQIVLDQHRQIEQLRVEIEQLKRRGGAAPFSKGTRKADPKPPGRKPGQGYFRFREAPPLAEAAENNSGAGLGVMLPRLRRSAGRSTA